MILADKKSQRNEDPLEAARARLNQEARAIDQRLCGPLTLPRKLLADVNVLKARLAGCPSSEALAPEAVAAAQRDFPKYFPATLETMIEEILADPEGYRQKVEEYEAGPAGRPSVPFDTENDHYRLIVRDPLRIREELFLFRAVLHYPSVGKGVFRALDLGTGSGRLAFCLADALLPLCDGQGFEIYGLDLNPANVKDALETKAAGEYGDRIKFVRGDMTEMPFEAGKFCLCNASSSTYLVPFYQRPLHLLEMARVLKLGGEGVITGPNENFSPEAYVRCMAATNLRTYLNPVNMIKAQKLGPIGMLIDNMRKNRVDFTLPDNPGLCAALRTAGCEIERAETWPRAGTTAIYSGVRFHTTRESEKRMQRFNEFMEKRRRESGVTTI
jgi:SAM-dependent methyltransferase